MWRSKYMRGFKDSPGCFVVKCHFNLLGIIASLLNFSPQTIQTGKRQSISLFHVNQKHK